jgi:Pyridoxamine 5'-phosphate oxidase like
MLETKAKSDAIFVSRLLAHVRPMGRVLNDPGEDQSRVRFLTDRRSNKAADMRRASEVSILFQHDPDLAFVTLIGKAELHEDTSETRSRWKAAYDVYFSQCGRPSECDFCRGRGQTYGTLDPRRHAGAVRATRDGARARRRGLAFDRLALRREEAAPATPASSPPRVRPACHGGCADRRAPIGARARGVPRQLRCRFP